MKWKFQGHTNDQHLSVLLYLLWLLNYRLTESLDKGIKTVITKAPGGQIKKRGERRGIYIQQVEPSSQETVCLIWCILLDQKTTKCLVTFFSD